LRKFKLTPKNYKLKYLGPVKERELIFWNEVKGFDGKYPQEDLLKFFGYWSEITHDCKKMKWEKEKTWETGKRLAYWCSKNKQNGY